MKTFALIFLSAALVLASGCNDVLWLEEYEFQVSLPLDTTPQQLLDMEKKLHEIGYTRVVFRTATSGWSDTPKGINVYATKQLPPLKNHPVQPLPPTTPKTSNN